MKNMSYFPNYFKIKIHINTGIVVLDWFPKNIQTKLSTFKNALFEQFIF
jgi:hypothetical protein